MKQGGPAHRREGFLVQANRDFPDGPIPPKGRFHLGLRLGFGRGDAARRDCRPHKHPHGPGGVRDVCGDDCLAVSVVENAGFGV